MRLECLGSDDPRFRRLYFHDGFNLVLADKTSNSDTTDSRNGAGKTSIVRLLRYLLGGKATAWIKKLKDYSDKEFWAKFTCSDGEHIVRRAAGGTEVSFDDAVMGVSEWQRSVGVNLLGFDRGHAKPTPGQVSGQLIRDDFSDPVRIHSSESDRDAGARIGYYLGFAEEALGKAELAASFEANKKALSKAVKDGFLGSFGPSKAEFFLTIAAASRLLRRSPASMFRTLRIAFPAIASCHKPTKERRAKHGRGGRGGRLPRRGTCPREPPARCLASRRVEWEG